MNETKTGTEDETANMPERSATAVPPLEDLPLFRGVDIRAVRSRLERCRRRALGPGEILLSPLAPNTSMFVLLSGRVSIRLDGAAGRPIASLKTGECVGEMSFLGNTVPSAYVVADEPTDLLEIDATTFWELIESSHGIAVNLLHILAGRLRVGNLRLSESERLATRDALTGLQNRRGLAAAYERAASGPLCLVMLDVDHFKQFNDRYGHQAGDEVLKAVARAMSKNCRETDVAARYGGEEFALLLPDMDFADGVKLAERLRHAVRETAIAAPDGTPLPRVTASFGIAERQPGETLEMLVARADEALYRAKREGRDRVCG
ncbi:MAG TPA: GGDEF domain-containing protein [Gammaproteobacteria bacterium]|nr:GGDEF domain-containing protein [Gammaproteobacteria bacterium]